MVLASLHTLVGRNARSEWHQCGKNSWSVSCCKYYSSCRAATARSRPGLVPGYTGSAGGRRAKTCPSYPRRTTPCTCPQTSRRHTAPSGRPLRTSRWGGSSSSQLCRGKRKTVVHEISTPFLKLNNYKENGFQREREIY